MTISLNGIIALLFKKSSSYEQLTTLLSDQPSADVVSALNTCIIQVPIKISEYATIVGLLNLKNLPIAQDIVTMVFTSIQTTLLLPFDPSYPQASDPNSGNSFITIKCMTRFLAELCNVRVIDPAQFIILLETMATVLDDPTPNIHKCDYFIYIVLSCIPWVGACLNENVNLDFAKLLSRISTFMNNRAQLKNQSHIALVSNGLSVYKNTQSNSYLDPLEMLWSQIQTLEADKWDTLILSKPYTPYMQLFEQSKFQDLPTFSSPVAGEAIKFCYQPTFWLFDEKSSDISQLPSVNHISRFILKDAICDIIRNFSLNHKEGSGILLDLSIFFSPEFTSNYNLFQAIVESIFSEMTRLPATHEKLVYYSILLMDLCRGALDKAPSAMGRALKIIFERMDTFNMDVECIRRLSEWFAHHLSNFGYGWNWKDWSGVVDANQESSKVVFIRETLSRCIRLSYYDRIKARLPESYFKSDLVFPMNEPKTNFKYESEMACGDENLFKLATKIKTAIGSRVDHTEVEKLLTELRHDSGASPDNSMVIDSGSPEISRDVFLNCLMLHGSKSFSHMLSIVERYLPILISFNNTAQDKLQTIQITASFWCENHQFLEIIMDKYMNYRVLDPSSIISWVLSNDVLDLNYSKFYIWSILRNTLSKILLKTEQITSKLEMAKNSNNMIEDGNESIPTLQAAYDSSIRERKEAFILVFQKFTEVLNFKIKNSVNEDPTETQWWKWVSGFMLEFGRQFQTHVMNIKFTLGVILFNEETDPRILEIWEEIKSINEHHDNSLI